MNIKITKRMTLGYNVCTRPTGNGLEIAKPDGAAIRGTATTIEDRVNELHRARGISNGVAYTRAWWWRGIRLDTASVEAALHEIRNGAESAGVTLA